MTGQTLQNFLLTELADVLQHLATAIPDDLVRAGAKPANVALAQRDAQSIVYTITADMTANEIDILLHSDLMVLALQFVGAHDRSVAFPAADGPYEAFVTMRDKRSHAQ